VSEAAATDERPPANGSPFIRGAQLFGLTGLAVAQPLLDILAGGAAFFVAHDASRAEVLLVVGAILLVPALLLWLVVEAVRLGSVTAGRWVMAALVGLLVGVTIMSAVDRANPLPLWAYAASTLLIAAAIAWMYDRLEPVRTFASFLAPAPLLFAGVFLFASPVSALVVANDPEALARNASTATDVVMVVFDELPLGALLDGSGGIDGERFPGFARLAATSTWYPNATTVAPETTAAVPALLTGRLPAGDVEIGEVPVAAQHPRSLFTMLGRSHDLRVHEWVTWLCPEDLCDERAEAGPDQQPSMLRDVSVIAGHQVLPGRLAEQLLPSIAGRWAGFGEESPEVGSVADDAAAREGQDRTRTPFEAALDELENAARPQLWFTHEYLPHRPPTLLPDGRSYPRGFAFDWYGNHREDASPMYRQRFLLQVGYVDRLVDQLLDRLDEQGMDDALVIVASDHGLNFQPHGHPRALDTVRQTELNEVLPVPLFVRYPGQGGGAIDDRDAQTIDLAPTIADVLEVELPEEWVFDGRSLRATDPPARPRYWQPTGELPAAIAADLDVTQFARQSEELFGPSGGPHDLYAMGPDRALVGTRPQRGAPVSDAVVEPLRPDDYDAVELGAASVPAFYEANASGLTPGEWVAVTVDGVVAGTGMVLDRSDGPARIKVMLDPDLLNHGRNEVEVLLIEEDPTLLRPIPVSTDG
jgi:hypothetical protein